MREARMRVLCWTLAGVVALGAASAAAAQDLAPMPRPDEAAEAPAGDGLVGADALDALLGPIALYPDSLLTQILVASTVPLDVMKADRWVDENAGLPAGDRQDAALAQGWDESVAVLAAGFPGVLQRMADDIDGTEALGEAVLAQTDAVLDSVQRLRAQASATGYLESNDAQTVSVDPEGEIAIAPADPEVVYVPAYDASVAYTTAPTAPTYVTSDPVYVDQGSSTGELLTTGAIAFGSAMLISEIFDDDDDWDDYWGPGAIDWDDDAFYHRPNVDIDGDVNIDRDRVVIDRDRDEIRDRIDRPGSIDPDRVRDGTWKPDPQKQADARAKLEARRDTGGGEGRPREGRIGEDGGAGLAAAAGAGAGAALGGGTARAKLEKSAARREGAAPHKPARDSALNARPKGASQVHRAQERGSGSLAKQHQAGSKPKPKAVGKSGGSRPAVKKSAPHKSSFERSGGGGAKARAASSRGHASAAKRGGGGRRR